MGGSKLGFYPQGRPFPSADSPAFGRLETLQRWGVSLPERTMAADTDRGLLPGLQPFPGQPGSAPGGGDAFQLNRPRFEAQHQRHQIIDIGADIRV